MEATVLETAVRAVELYASQHPRPTQVNIKQAAEMLGLSVPTVRKLMKAGEMSLNRCGLIPIEQVDRVRAVRSSS
ncbi:helix-turn-helix domain-containing protein [Cupriavidus pinatubonensis]|uniref:helix-turn-helix domain-containing protein n=1 Tax=Cupriavidus pinatubonensis TaxID=248026 RepID=UPI003621DA08